MIGGTVRCMVRCTLVPVLSCSPGAPSAFATCAVGGLEGFGFSFVERSFLRASRAARGIKASSYKHLSACDRWREGFLASLERFVFSSSRLNLFWCSIGIDDAARSHWTRETNHHLLIFSRFLLFYRCFPSIDSFYR